LIAFAGLKEYKTTIKKQTHYVM